MATRRRRLTLAPTKVISPASSSGSRFSALAEVDREEDSEASLLGSVASEVALAVLEDDGGGWSVVRSARRKNSQELIQDF